MQPENQSAATRTSLGSTKGLFDFIVHRPVGAGVAFVTLLVIGAIAYLRIPLQLMPSGFQAPSLNVWVPNIGSSARENEEKVARPIEEQLRTMSGIERVRSSSQDEYVWMRVNFDASLNLDLAKAEVRDRLERARPGLPPTVGPIEFWSEDADQFPISFFGVLHSGDSDRTDFLLDAVVKPRLEAVPGVSKLDLFGVLDDSMRIELDEDRVLAAGLDLGQLIERLSKDNFAEPLGEVDDGGRRYLLRSDMRLASEEEIAAYPLGEGLVIGDVARVERVKSVRDSLSRIDGQYAYYGVARKDTQADVVESSRALAAAFEELERDPRLGGQIRFLPFFMQGSMIEGSLAQLKSTAVTGGLLAVMTLVVFLRRLRLTIAVALSIPVSALAAIAVEYFTGGSFNLLTMVGVTLGIGMLVDNAIVVVENIARLRDQGLEPRQAAIEGTREIALAITLATLTTVVVFLPLIFMSDNAEARLIFGGIGIPLVVSLLFSLGAAVLFLPVITARILGQRPARLNRLALVFAPLLRLPARGLGALIFAAQALRAGAVRLLEALGRGLARLLAPAGRLALPLLLVRIGLAGALVYGGWTRFAAYQSQRELLPELAAQSPWFELSGLALLAVLCLWLPPRLARRRVAAPTPPDRTLLASDSVLALTERAVGALVAWAIARPGRATLVAILSFASIGIPASNLSLAAFAMDGSGGEVEYWVKFQTEFTLLEADEQVRIHEAFLGSLKEEWGFDHQSTRFDRREANFEIYWDRPLAPSKLQALEAELKRRAPQPPGHSLAFADSRDANERSRVLARFELRGPDSRVLEQLAREAKPLLESVPGLSAVTSPLDEAEQQIEVRVDRELASALSVDSQTAFNNVAWALRGWPLPRFMDEGREIPFLIEYDVENVAGFSTLRDLGIWNGERSVALTAFSKLDFEPTTREINRVNGQTTFTLTAEVDNPLETTRLTERGYLALEALDLPRGYSLGTDDSARARQQEEAGEMLAALGLSLVLIFMLMGVLFESVVLPLSVMFSIPFAILGALWVLWLSGTPMDVMGWIGLIILAGVVVNNGIVLIDCVHRLREEGLGIEAALREGSVRRVRPILMTALTTVFGLLPMILTEPPSDAIDYRALGVIVASGLTTSTFFTLWVVPLAYLGIERANLALIARIRWLAASRDERQRLAAGDPGGAAASA
jgi:HAE1 family hydrophobic/amphiphilic exporter-1